MTALSMQFQARALTHGIVEPIDVTIYLSTITSKKIGV